MFKWLENRKKRKKLKLDWQLVKTIKTTVNWTDSKQIDEIFYYLFENGLKERRIEIAETGWAKSEKYGKKHKYYLKTIYPWTKGTNYSDVPSYWDTRKDKNEKYVWELYKQLLGN